MDHCLRRLRLDADDVLSGGLSLAHHETSTGVKTGPHCTDHEHPLVAAVVVNDMGGLQAQDEVELFPSTGVVGGATSPTGIPITVGPATGTPPPAVTGIVHSTVGLSAPTTHLIGEATWTFDHWSDGGDRTHSVPVASVSMRVSATALTSPSWPARVCSTWPVSISHTLSVRSYDADTARLPSGVSV
jgi:hypothetical protein